ncbi:MAG: bifunctional oligoribonuclease/PAP phosphatase NrnA [Bacilli bacterium]|jgi:phosphoesterase RecJ-like protein|nr:bifunctional oligoribonuclease/PAP phosphatase NrnA [Bacilli bacterium]
MKLDQSVKDYGEKFKKEYSLLRRAIRRYDRIVVYRHSKPDYDAMGTQMGLVTFLKDNFPNKEIHFVGDNHVTFTPRLFPVTEKLPDSFFADPFMAIVVDVGDTDRIADPRFQKAKYVAKMDHHPCKEQIARHPIVDLGAAAASEIVVDFCLNWKGASLSKEAARYFYIGLVGDSGRFMYSSTTAHTFAIAQGLIATGISISDIYLEMYEKKIDDLKVTAYVLNHFAVSPHGVAYYCLPAKVQEELKITSEQGKTNVNLFSNIAGINAWCSITEDPNPKDWCWRVSIRSKKADISPIAFKWGGGGHAQASGARIKDLTELDAFIKDLDDMFA